MNPTHSVSTGANKPVSLLRAAGFSAMVLGGTALTAPALAQSTSTKATINALQTQLQSLQAEINELKAQEAQTQTEVTAVKQMPPPPAPIPTASNAPKGTAGYAAHIGGVKITPGGFIEAAVIDRSRNETTSIGSNFGSIPLPSTANYRTGEFRMSGQQSRLSLLAQGDYDDNLKLAGYWESDFISAAPTANSNESNSYNLRMRLAFFTADLQNMGLHFAAGQTWSLATLYKGSLTPRNENSMQQIDAQYVVGYNWARQMSLRAVADVTPWAQFAVSVEAPQTVFKGTAPSGVILNNTGTSQLDPSTTYSTDVAPDVIAKVGVNPGFGHYEVYGLARWMHDQTDVATGTTGNGSSNTVMAGGVGAGAIIPVIPKLINFQASGLVGTGIGRYGSVGLPDATVSSTGAVKPIREVEALVGVVAHVLPQVDLYGYGGIEEEHATATSKVGSTLYGYGNPDQVNTGCWTVGGTCGAQTKAVRELTFGGWYRFYKGRFGMAEVGVQDAEIYLDTFSGIGGAPKTNDNIFMTSFRYYPF